MDPATGESRGFGFVTFSTLEDAQSWVDATKGILDLGEGQQALRIEYTRNTNWTCPTCGFDNWKKPELGCFKCVRGGSTSRNYRVNDGTTDIGSAPTSLLLVRGLDPLTTEMKLLEVFKGLAPQLLHVRLVKDRATHASSGFAFIQLPDSASATQLIAASYTTPVSLDGRYLSLTYSHPNSFIVIYGNSQWVTSSYIDIDGNPVQIGYWDENAYAKEYPESGALAIPLEAAPKDESDLFAEALLGSIACDPVPVDVTTFKQPVVYKDGKPAQSVTATSLTPLVSPTSASQPDPVALISQTAMKPIVLSEKGKKKTVTAKGKAGAQIAKWHERQEELAKTEPENNALEPLDLSDEALLKRIPSVETLNGHYEDLNMIACLLCERQFKSLEDLKKHQAKSNLHKTNMDALKEKKIEELRTTLEENHKSDQYRNRALERRQQESLKPTKKRQAISFQMKKTVVASASTPISEDNIGNKMLQKMGWKTGEALGAKKDGIIEPIAPKGYAQGTGLGASRR